MKLFVLVAAMFSTVAMAQSTRSISITAASSGDSFKIDQAVYNLVPTETVVREVPGCIVGEASTCSEEVVVARMPVVEVYVDYTDRMLDYKTNKRYLKFSFSTDLFSAAELAELKDASPMRRWDSKGVRKNFARGKFALQVSQTKSTAEVVDTAKSTLCRETEAGPELGCVENIVYKTVPSTAQVVTLTVK